VNVGVEFGMEDWDGTGWVLGVGCGGVEDGARALTSEKTRCVTCCAPYGRLYLRSLTLHGINLQLFLECWLLGSLRTFCNFFLKITLKFSVLMLKSQLNTYFYKSE